MVQRPKSSARKKVATAKKLLAEVEEKESTRKQEAWGVDSSPNLFHEYLMNLVNC